MPMYHFRCTDPTCAGVFEAFSQYTNGRVEPVLCKCSHRAELVWLKAPGIFSDEKPPREELQSARMGLARGVPRFTGETRSELNAWKEEHGLVSMSADEARRGNATINTKTKLTETAAFDALLDEELAKARAIAQHPDSDAYHEAFAAIEQPSTYDTNAVHEQVAAAGAEAVAGTQPDLATAVAAEI